MYSKKVLQLPLSHIGLLEIRRMMKGLTDEETRIYLQLVYKWPRKFSFSFRKANTLLTSLGLLGIHYRGHFFYEITKKGVLLVERIRSDTKHYGLNLTDCITENPNKITHNLVSHHPESKMRRNPKFYRIH